MIHYDPMEIEHNVVEGNRHHIIRSFPRWHLPSKIRAYRRQIIYGKYRAEIGKILKTICERYEVEIIEANACPDHIHMLVAIPPKMLVSRFMGILKRKSALMIFDRFANLKYRYGNRHFWCRGYFVDTVGRNKTAIQKYIQNQLAEDQVS